jgi:hypothetical protein
VECLGFGRQGRDEPTGVSRIRWFYEAGGRFRREILRPIDYFAGIFARVNGASRQFLPRAVAAMSGRPAKEDIRDTIHAGFVARCMLIDPRSRVARRWKTSYSRRRNFMMEATMLTIVRFPASMRDI